jgi:hypothetical protein
MKKIIINTGYILLAIYVGMLAGCADMNDIQQQYLDRGERIYTGKADLLTVNGGHHRVQVTGIMHYAKTAEYCIIRWTNGTDQDSLTVNASNWQATDTMKVILDGLSEGAYRIFVQTYDKDGNKSLNVECNGNAYGENFISVAKAKSMTKMEPQIDGMVLRWNVSEDAVLVEVQYEGNTGLKTQTFPGNVSECKITDWKLGGNIQFRTAFLPEPDAIDMLYSEWINQSFPPDDILDKTKIVSLRSANDATAGYSGTIDAVFNGVISDGANQFCSSDGVGVPQHLTFDLGVQTNLTRLEMWARSDGYNNWNPKKIQFWGIADITGAEIALPSGDTGWEAEAVAKGWTKLLDGTCDYPVNNKLQFDTFPKIRYLIVRTTEENGPPSTGTGAYVIIQEITLYSDDITEL